jgi:8-oxo-dGTP pyrophosphatase MutT (NUDIX family)
VFSGDDVLLLAVAAKENDYPAFYQPITGGIEVGECAEEACRRELCEETGLQLEPSSLHALPGLYEVVIIEQLTVCKTIFYVDTPSSDIRLNSSEHIGYIWCNSRRVDLLLYWQSNKDTWSRVIRYRLNGDR